MFLFHAELLTLVFHIKSNVIKSTYYKKCYFIHIQTCNRKLLNILKHKCIDIQSIRLIYIEITFKKLDS